MAFKCKLGLHSYVPVKDTAQTPDLLFNKAMSEAIPDSNHEAHKYVFDLMRKKIKDNIIYNNVCLECGKVRYDVDMEYNKLYKKVSKLLKEFEGITNIKKAADKLYMEGCACGKGCNFVKDKERV